MEGAPLTWHSDLDSALSEAKQVGKPIFALFHAEWCGFCRMLEDQTLTDPKVRAALGSFVGLKVDIDRDPRTKERYGVGPIPALLILNSAGEVLARGAGYKPPEAFLGLLDYGKARNALTQKPNEPAAAYTAAVTSYAADVSRPERKRLAEAALALLGEGQPGKRARLLLVRGKAALAEQSAAENALNDLREARELDSDNALGVREEADWLLVSATAGDDAARGKAAEQFLSEYPAGKVRNPALRAQALELLYESQIGRKDYAAAVRTLERLKAGHGDLVDAARIDQVIAQLRKMAEQSESK